jgi:nucleoid DNA-binding protein
MKKLALAELLAKQTNVSTGAAADDLDRMVHNILKNLRKGKSALVPGLGRFTLGKDAIVRFEGNRVK